MLYNITNLLLFCKKLNLTGKSWVDNTVQQQRYKNNNDKKKRPRKKSLLVTLHWKYPRKIAKCLYTFFQVQPRTASLAHTLPLPPLPRVDGKQEHKQLFPLSVPATLPEMTMHRASVCVSACVCVFVCTCFLVLLLDGNGMQTHWTKENGQVAQQQREQQQSMASSTATPSRDIVQGGGGWGWGHWLCAPLALQSGVKC